MSLRLTAVIEIPKGSKYKYEIDKNDGKLVLDRVIKRKIPHNYGYIPGTICDDGDPLDIFLISNLPVPPLTKVKAMIIGVLKCKDGGVNDDKLIGVLEGEHHNFNLALEHINDYLSSYKEGFEVIKFFGINEATDVYTLSQVWEPPKV